MPPPSPRSPPAAPEPPGAPPPRPVSPLPSPPPSRPQLPPPLPPPPPSLSPAFPAPSPPTPSLPFPPSCPLSLLPPPRPPSLTSNHSAPQHPPALPPACPPLSPPSPPSATVPSSPSPTAVPHPAAPSPSLLVVNNESAGNLVTGNTGAEHTMSIVLTTAAVVAGVVAALIGRVAMRTARRRARMAPVPMASPPTTPSSMPVKKKVFRGWTSATKRCRPPALVHALAVRCARSLRRERGPHGSVHPEPKWLGAARSSYGSTDCLCSGIAGAQPAPTAPEPYCEVVTAVRPTDFDSKLPRRVGGKMLRPPSNALVPQGSSGLSHVSNLSLTVASPGNGNRTSASHLPPRPTRKPPPLPPRARPFPRAQQHRQAPLLTCSKIHRSAPTLPDIEVRQEDSTVVERLERTAAERALVKSVGFDLIPRLVQASTEEEIVLPRPGTAQLPDPADAIDGHTDHLSDRTRHAEEYSTSMYTAPPPD